MCYKVKIGESLTRAKRWTRRCILAYNGGGAKVGLYRSRAIYNLDKLLLLHEDMLYSQIVEASRLIDILINTYKLQCNGLNHCHKLLMNFEAAKKVIQPRKGRPVGYKMSDATKAKISGTKKGRKHTEETRKKISDGVFDYYTCNPTDKQRAKNARIMCADTNYVKNSLRMMNWWAANPAFKLAFSDFIKAMHESKRDPNG